jgi:hypothetical protein
METKRMKKGWMGFGVIFLMLFFFTAEAFSWGDATHVYISDRLKARFGYNNINEMWGSLGPDIFNFIFDETLCPSWLAEQTHTEGFLKVWNAASTTSEKALAYGFLTHNEVWGADTTAHISGLTFGQNWGYINEKAMALLNTPINPTEPHPTFGDIFSSIGLNPDQQQLVAHVIAEYAIDIMLKNDADPFIGRKVAIAAHARSKGFPALLVKAFAADYANQCFGGDYLTAAYIIAAAEEEYRNGMISYGQAISQSEEVAVQLIAEQIVALAPGFLDPTQSLPPNAVDLLKAAIYASMEICNDYLAEINATIDFVESNLVTNGITY